MTDQDNTTKTYIVIEHDLPEVPRRPATDAEFQAARESMRRSLVYEQLLGQFGPETAEEWLDACDYMPPPAEGTVLAGLLSTLPTGGGILTSSNASEAVLRRLYPRNPKED
jgi:hypothetical protein